MIPDQQVPATSRSSDHLLSIAFLALLAIGVLGQWTAESPPGPTLNRHIFRILVGLVLFWFGISIPRDQVRKMTFFGWLLANFSLILVLFFPALNGVHRWIIFKGLSFAPSAVATLATILLLADCLSSETEREDRAKLATRNAGALFLPCGLILAQPDYSTAIALLMACALLFFVAGHGRSLLIFLSVATPVIVFKIFSAPYSRQRIVGFLAQESDPYGTGYQIFQSAVALGSGGLTGGGLGSGVAKYGYLPEIYSTFLLSHLGEEWGFVGICVVVALIGAVVYRLLSASLRANNKFDRLLTAGMAFWLISNAVLNLATVFGMIPVAGIPFPLIGYGGTLLVVQLFGLGLAQQVARESGPRFDLLKPALDSARAVGRSSWTYLSLLKSRLDRLLSRESESRLLSFLSLFAILITIVVGLIQIVLWIRDLW